MRLSLLSISFYELSVKRDEIDLTQEVGIPENDRNIEVEIKISYRDAEVGVDYRCVLIVRFSQATITVDAAISYRSEESIFLNKDVRAEFGNSVAIMSLFPYLRQAISDMGARIGYETTLPVIKLGQIEF